MTPASMIDFDFFEALIVKKTEEREEKEKTNEQ